MSDQPKPPYVEFEVRPVEDRSASEAEGHLVYRDEVFAIVTPAGTRDRLEKVAKDWIEGLKEGAQQDRIPHSWVEAYQHKLSLFMTNQEVPLDGTPIQSMTTLSPAQVKNCLNANIRTVEDLAEATEEAMLRIGMGGRELKQKAKAWLDTVSKNGKPAQELNDLRVKTATQDTQIEELTKTVATLQAQLKTLETAKD